MRGGSRQGSLLNIGLEKVDAESEEEISGMFLTWLIMEGLG